MSVGTSNSTVISSTNPEAHNLNTINASAAPKDDGSPATIFTTTPKNRHGSASSTFHGSAAQNLQKPISFCEHLGTLPGTEAALGRE